jgi:hypothetical protein
MSAGKGLKEAIPLRGRYPLYMGRGASQIDLEIDRFGFEPLEYRPSLETLKRNSKNYDKNTLDDPDATSRVIRASFQLLAQGDTSALNPLTELTRDLIGRDLIGPWNMTAEQAAARLLLATRVMKHSSLLYCMAYSSDGYGGLKYNKDATWHLSAESDSEKTLCGKAIAYNWKRGAEYLSKRSKRCTRCYKVAGSKEEFQDLLAREEAAKEGTMSKELQERGDEIITKAVAKFIPLAKKNPLPLKADSLFRNSIKEFIAEEIAARTLKAYSGLTPHERFDRLFQPFSSDKGKENLHIKNTKGWILDLLTEEDLLLLEDNSLESALTKALASCKLALFDNVDPLDSELLAHLSATLWPHVVGPVVEANLPRGTQFFGVWRREYPQLITQDSNIFLKS